MNFCLAEIFIKTVAIVGYNQKPQGDRVRTQELITFQEQKKVAARPLEIEDEP